VAKATIEAVRPIWGLDPARFGDDRTALAKRRGRVLMEPVTAWRGLDTMQTAGRVLALYEDATSDTVEAIGADPDGSLFRRLKGWTKASIDHLAEWRSEADESYEFYNGYQWSREELAIFEADGRPAPVFNLVQINIDAIAGLEVNNRQDVKYLPRTAGDAKVNELLSSAAMWVRDQAKSEREESDAFTDAAITGIGVTETRKPEPDMIAIDRRDPRTAFWDRNATKRNLADRRYAGRVVWLDLDEAEDMFAEAREGKKREIFVAMATIAKAFKDDSVKFDVIADEAPSSPNQQQDILGKLAILSHNGIQLPPEAQAVVIENIGLPTAMADTLVQAIAGNDPKLKMLQGQLQDGAQQLQAAQAENLRLKADRSIEAQKLQVDAMRADTERSRAQAEILAQTGGVAVGDKVLSRHSSNSTALTSSGSMLIIPGRSAILTPTIPCSAWRR